MPQPDLPPTRAGEPLTRADGLPSTLRWAVWLLASQAVGLVAVLVFLIIADASASGPSLRGGLLVTGYVALMAASFGGLSWALSRQRGWARGPAMVLELLGIPVGYYLATGGVAALGVPVMVIALVAAGILLAPSTRAALGRQ